MLPCRFRLISSGSPNYFLLGDTPYPEDQTELETREAVLNLRCDQPCWHCGGRYNVPWCNVLAE
jgi:hypothetical protein